MSAEKGGCLINIAELFINLGIKGDDKAIGAIDKVEGGLKKTASASLEAKAAIVGAMYALERLFSTSGKYGAHLTQVDTLLGGGMKQTVQTYENAARQFSVSAGDVDAAFIGLQKTMTKMERGEGMPIGMRRIADVLHTQVGELQQLALEATKGHPEAFIQKLQEYAKKEANSGMRNDMLESLGMSPGMISALSKQAFTPERLAKASKSNYSDKEVDSLNKSSVAWDNLLDKIEKVTGRLNAKFGEGLAAGISKLVDHITPLVDKFADLAQKIDLMKQVGRVFVGWGLIFEGIGNTLDKMKELANKKEPVTEQEKKEEAARKALPPEERYRQDFADSKGIGAAIVAFLHDFYSDLKDVAKGATVDFGPGPAAPGGEPGKPAAPGTPRGIPLKGVPGGSAAVPPIPVSVVRIAERPAGANVNVSQTLNFQHEGKDAVKTAESVRGAVQHVYRQNPAQANGN